ncbi:AAA family ATPase [Streptomyces sp. NPDC046324]|uniref:AAA family ATPase n=1 Tax=Streptomyces sp. NPDC046324 TaxID=3154915 RepID=UPI0033C86A3B
MTTTIRIDSLRLQTSEGEVRYDFESALTVLAGPTGVGKTTLLELIKYGFGAGDARLASVASESVNDVVLDITIGTERYRVARSLDGEKSKNVRITNLRTQQRLPDHSTGDSDGSFNRFLLAKFGLPDDIRAAATKGKSTKAGSRVTFGDIFKYIYVPQYTINRDIVDARESYYSPKRRAVFELLFGLTDPEILALQSKATVLNGDIDAADFQLRTVLDFLRDSNTSSREDVEQALAGSIADQESAAEELSALREELDPVIDRQTQTLRDLLTEAERSLAEAQAASHECLRQRAEITAERSRVEGDLARLHRMRDAGARLADIEFLVCPRCMQSLTNRALDSDLCRVCLQPDPVSNTQDIGSYETQQLTLQLADMADQSDQISIQLERARKAISDRTSLVRNLTADLDRRTSERVTPRLQAFSDASERLATARTKNEQLESVLRQWDRVADIEGQVAALRASQTRLRAAAESRKRVLEKRRIEVLTSLNEVFQKTVAELKIKTVKTASFDEESYLPIINGKIFTKSLMIGGGQMTATQIAYWVTLMEVALKLSAPYPSLLILDGPRLALNTATETCEAIYKRLSRLAAESGGRAQLIVSDNELPANYQASFTQIDFTYTHPTVYTIPHPGEGEVETIDSVDE